MWGALKQQVAEMKALPQNVPFIDEVLKKEVPAIKKDYAQNKKLGRSLQEAPHGEREAPGTGGEAQQPVCGHQ